MKSRTSKEAPQQAPGSRADQRAAAWSADRAAAWALTPSALIPFGSFVPPRNPRRTARGNDRR